MRHLMILLLILLFSPFALAQVVYKSIDRQGHVLFSERPARNAVAVKRMVLQDTLSPAQAQNVRQLEAQILRQQMQEAGIPPKDHLNPHQLTVKIEKSYAVLKQANLLLESAQTRLAKHWHECGNKTKKLTQQQKINPDYLGHPVSLIALEKEVYQAKQQLARYQAQLDQLTQ